MAINSIVRFLLSLSLFMGAAYSSAWGQPVLFADNNPLITDAEAEWLNAHLPVEGFDFKGKCIGFVDVQSGGFYGIGKSAWPMLKKRMKSCDPKAIRHKLVALNDAEKTKTRGYDALLLIVDVGNKGKLKRLTREAAIAHAMNRYPQIPVDAGVDTNAVLNKANAIFFNELIRSGLYPNTSFDFTGKKVAILNTNCGYGTAVRVSFSEHIRHVRSELDVWGFSTGYAIYYLTPDEKQSSGGYDVVVTERCKKGLTGAQLVKLLAY